MRPCGPRFGRLRAGTRNPPELVEGAAIIDSQSVKTTGKVGPRGYDAGKKVFGGKRHIIVDTMGLLLAVAVYPADIQALRQAQEGWGQAGHRQAGWQVSPQQVCVQLPTQQMTA